MVTQHWVSEDAYLLPSRRCFEHHAEPSWLALLMWLDKTGVRCRIASTLNPKPQIPQPKVKGIRKQPLANQ